MAEKQNPYKGDIPLGFGMALAQDMGAMQYFASLDRERQDKIIAKTKTITSKSEMKSFVNSLNNMT